MGNLCGKVDDSEPSGRTLGGAGAPRPAAAGAGPQATSAPVPARVGGPPRTLGGGGAVAGSSAADDARRRAAEAAQARNAPKAATGKLGAQLEAQRRENRIDTLKKASEAEVRRREIDAQASVAAHN